MAIVSQVAELRIDEPTIIASSTLKDMVRVQYFLLFSLLLVGLTALSCFTYASSAETELQAANAKISDLQSKLEPKKTPGIIVNPKVKK